MFEKWLRTHCFQKPTKEAYDLAKSSWNAALIEAQTAADLHRSPTRPLESLVMPARIEKQIDFFDIPSKWRATPSMIECWIVGQLKEAGMPIEGTLLFHGLTTGKLTVFDSPETGMRHFIWEA